MITVIVGTLSMRYRLALVIGDSMLPALKSGELLVVDRTAFREAGPAGSEVVLARVDRDYVLKRIVGLPGQRIEVESGEVYLNGVRQDPGYAVLAGEIDIEPGVLAPGRYAILGDNRSYTDKRTLHAVVSRDEIEGRVLYRLSWSGVETVK